MPVTQKLKDYYIFYQDLKQNGGPEENVDLFEQVIHLEEDIMAAYGLPPSHSHLQILWKLTNAPELTDEVVQETEQELQQAATDHLMAPVKTNLEVLQEALQEKHSAFNVLPEIGQPTHDYPLFLYEELLMKGNTSPEEVLQELETVKELDCYGEVATLLFRHKKSFRKTNIYKSLKPRLKFLDIYLTQLKELGESEENSFFVSGLMTVEEQEEQAILSLPEAPEEDAPALDPASYNPKSVLLSGTFEIEECVFAEDTAVTVNGILHTEKALKPISLGFEKEELLKLLSHYAESGNHLQTLLNDPQETPLEEQPTIIHLFDSMGATLRIEQHYFMAYKPLVMDENGHHKVMEDDFYLVDEILDKERVDAEQVKFSKEYLAGLFQYVSAWYQTYLDYLLEGINEKKARKQSGLENTTLFEMARHLYNLEKHGGNIDLT